MGQQLQQLLAVPLQFFRKVIHLRQQLPFQDVLLDLPHGREIRIEQMAQFMAQPPQDRQRPLGAIRLFPDTEMPGVDADHLIVRVGGEGFVFLLPAHQDPGAAFVAPGHRLGDVRQVSLIAGRGEQFLVGHAARLLPDELLDPAV